MEKTEQYIQCSHYKCDKSFSPEYISYPGLLLPPINEENKYDQILEGMLKTRMFCMKCCENHARLICLNSKIKI